MTGPIWDELKKDSRLYRVINGERLRSVLVGPWAILIYALAIMAAAFMETR